MYMFLFLMLLQVIQLTGADGHGVIRIARYENPKHKDANGHCCESLSNSGCKPNDCDPYFHICIGIKNTGGCTIADTLTRVYQDTGSINFGSQLGSLTNPIQLSISNLKSGIDIVINVMDKDDGVFDNDDPIGNIHAVLASSPTTGQTNVTKQTTFSGGQARITFEYGILCDRYFYGDCTVYCRPDHVHYRCGNEGQKICLNGWKGSDCLTNATFCESNPCQNNAICVSDVTNSTVCHCKVGFTGKYCGTVVSTPSVKTSDMTLNPTTERTISVIRLSTKATRSPTTLSAPSSHPTTSQSSVRWSTSSSAAKPTSTKGATHVYSTSASMVPSSISQTSSQTLVYNTTRLLDHSSSRMPSEEPSVASTATSSSGNSLPTTQSLDSCYVNMSFIHTGNDTVLIEIKVVVDATHETFQDVIENLIDNNLCKSLATVNVSAWTDEGDWFSNIFVDNCNITRYDINQLTRRLEDKLCSNTLVYLRNSLATDASSTGEIAGGVIAALVCICLLVVIAVFIRRKWLKMKVNDRTSDMTITNSKESTPKEDAETPKPTKDTYDNQTINAESHIVDDPV